MKKRKRNKKQKKNKAWMEAFRILDKNLKLYDFKEMFREVLDKQCRIKMK
jgi:hypothetical protein